MSRDERLGRAVEQLDRAGLDAMLVAPSPDLRWLTGYDPPPLERLTALLVRPDRDPILVVPRLEAPLAAGSPAAGLAELRAWDDGEDPYTVVADLLGDARTIAITDRAWAVHALAVSRAAPRAELVAASEALPALRAVKDDAEIGEIARAARGADAAFEEVAGAGLRGRSERDVAALLADGLRGHEHVDVAFTIVGSGPNGASPHHEPTDRRIESGDAVVMDFGGQVASGYCSDITRTVGAGESPPVPEVREVHAIVAEAQRVAIDAVAPGVAVEEIDRVARDVITEAGYGDRFVHRTGHGIGLEVHEPPYLVAGNAARLAPGMCFSVEPGIYLEGRFGVRIEDIVVVTDDGARRLNDADRSLRSVG